MTPKPILARDKLKLRGAKALSDTELLMIFIGSGTANQDVRQIAQSLLHQFGSLRNLFHTNLERLLAVEGIGMARAVLIKASCEVYDRMLLNDTRNRKVLSSPSKVRALLLHRLSGAQQERFCCLYLDHQHRLIAFEELSKGSISSAQVYPRELVRRSLDLNASALIIAHNHPSGHPEPSDCDHEITRHLQRLLKAVDVRLLDHMVIGSGEVVSLAERGIIER